MRSALLRWRGRNVAFLLVISTLMLPVQVNDGGPFTPLTRPLAACRLAIVTTAGLHRRGDQPFGPSEQTYRVIPADTPPADIVQSQTSLGFDRTAIMRDLNISFPVDRLREMVAHGRSRCDRIPALQSGEYFGVFPDVGRDAQGAHLLEEVLGLCGGPPRLPERLDRLQDGRVTRRGGNQ